MAPDSAVKIHAESDSVLYSIIVLRGQYEAGTLEGDEYQHGKFIDYIEPLKAAFREKRFIVREYSYDASKAGSLDKQLEQAKTEVQATNTTIIRWCRAHYGEVYSGWLHLKVIRAFAESVLRYGLPVDFSSMFIEPNMKREKQLKVLLGKTIAKLIPHLTHHVEEGEEDDDTENLPYVCHKFNVIGASNVA